MSFVVQFDNATFSRANGEPALREISWSIADGETWGITGPIGSGKTTLTDAILGRLHLQHGNATWPILDRVRSTGRKVSFPSDVIGRVGFKEESRLFTYANHYYQQRFNFIEPDDDLTLEQFLTSGFSGTITAIDDVTDRLGIGSIRSLSLIKLSNGQTRRARIARALLSRPELLILDEPFIGLDRDGRREVDRSLFQLIESGTRLLIIAAESSLPTWITHVGRMEAGSLLTLADRKKLRGVDVFDPSPVKEIRHSNHEPVIELENVTVAHGGKVILDAVNWSVRRGDRWAIVGPNGSGKTTLLSLICGDHPQAYCNSVRLFGKQRGTGETIWDIKRQVGMVSPELHFYFTTPLTANRAAATGFFDILVPRPTTVEQDQRIDHLFAYFGVSELKDRYFARLSAGQQRIVLLIRALVKSPPLLVLDEPFQVLDSTIAQRARNWIDDEVSSDTTVLFVTHNEAELPRSIDRCLQFEAGGRVSIKPVE